MSHDKARTQPLNLVQRPTARCCHLVNVSHSHWLTIMTVSRPFSTNVAMVTQAGDDNQDS